MPVAVADVDEAAACALALHSEAHRLQAEVLPERNRCLADLNALGWSHRAIAEYLSERTGATITEAGVAAAVRSTGYRPPRGNRQGQTIGKLP